MIWHGTFSRVIKCHIVSYKASEYLSDNGLQHTLNSKEEMYQYGDHLLTPPLTGHHNSASWWHTIVAIEMQPVALAHPSILAEKYIMVLL